MTYRVIKTIKGRRYIYEQCTWREGKRVRTKSLYVGPADGAPSGRRLMRKIDTFIKANMTPRHAVIDEYRMLQQHNERVAREDQQREAKLSELHAKFGLRISDTKPIVTVSPASAQTAPAIGATTAPQPDIATGAKESPSNIDPRYYDTKN